MNVGVCTLLLISRLVALNIFSSFLHYLSSMIGIFFSLPLLFLMMSFNILFPFKTTFPPKRHTLRLKVSPVNIDLSWVLWKTSKSRRWLRNEREISRFLCEENMFSIVYMILCCIYIYIFVHLDKMDSGITLLSMQ